MMPPDSQSTDLLQQLDLVPLPYQSLDAAGNFLQVNQAWLELFGCEREAVIGRFFGDVMQESSRPLLGVTFAAFKREGYVSSPVFEARRQDTGETLLLKVNGRIERDAEGGFVRSHCLLTDVTARAKAEAELQALSDLLQQVTAHLPGMVFQFRLAADGSSCLPYASEGI
ncbi:MAG: PAS domain S-box protein, partial [Gammaproteobacteria bacterium]|nr:PAS domain S-box protein [Gammaproteobacteria bacterium]